MVLVICSNKDCCYESCYHKGPHEFEKGYCNVEVCKITCKKVTCKKCE